MSDDATISIEHAMMANRCVRLSEPVVGGRLTIRRSTPGSGAISVSGDGLPLEGISVTGCVTVEGYRAPLQWWQLIERYRSWREPTRRLKWRVAPPTE